MIKQRPLNPEEKQSLLLPFDGTYRKMPPGVQYCDTYLKDVGIIEKKDIPPAELERDTLRNDGTKYELPEGKLIWIALWTDCLPEPKVWYTHRRFNQERYDQLRKRLGQQVTIKIEEKPPTQPAA